MYHTRNFARIPVPILVAVVVGLAAAGVPAPAAAGFKEAARDTKPTFGVRYRFETVSQTGIDEAADASTARIRFGWVMGKTDGFSAGAQADYVARLGAERYNSTANGRTDYPVVADPTGFDVNQAFVRYRWAGVTVTAGRQRIAHPGQRFVGFKAWRQNEQSFDALRIETERGPVDVDYAYVARVNRIFGPRDGAQPAAWSSDSHLLRTSWTVADGHALGAFAYLLDFDNDNGPGNSNATMGVDYTGGFGGLGIAATAARQRDWGAQPVTYSVPFYAAELRIAPGTVKLALGWEGHGSDGGYATVQTPIGAEHIYRGWVDKFAARKPAAGLQDAYLSATAKFGDVTLGAALHGYRSWRDGIDYGAEAGVSAGYARDGFSLLAKVSRYDADAHGTDTTKAWFVLGYSL